MGEAADGAGEITLAGDLLQLVVEPGGKLPPPRSWRPVPAPPTGS